MSFLSLHKTEPKKITFLGSEYQLTPPSMKEFMILMKASQDENFTSMAEGAADILEKHLIGEDLTAADIIDTFTFDEMSEICIALMEGLAEVDKSGK